MAAKVSCLLMMLIMQRQLLSTQHYNLSHSTTFRQDKWLVLGDMLELGELEQQFHEDLADAIDPTNIHQVCLFGPRMKWLYEKLQTRVDAENLVWTEEIMLRLLKKSKQVLMKILLFY